MARRRYYDEHGNEVRPPRRGGCLKYIGIGAILLVVGSGLGMLGNSEDAPTVPETPTVSQVVSDNTSTVEAESVEDEVETEPTYGIGDTVTAGNLSAVVNGVSKESVIHSSFQEHYPSTGNYLLLDMTVRNDGNEATMVDSNNFTLVRGETTYDADGSAMIWVNDDSNSFLLNNLNPEATLSGTVIFDISENAASDPDLQLEVSSNMFFGEKVYINLN